MSNLQFTVLLLHILAAVIWIGGMVFLGVVLIPVLREPSIRSQAAILMQRTGRRFRNLGWTCLLLLIVTGVINLERWGVAGSAQALRLRRLASWMGRLNLVLGFGIVAAAIVLVRGVPI